MPHADQHTGKQDPSQAQLCAEQCWEELVHSRLPASLEEKARELGAFERVRAVPNACTLLRALLAYVLSLSSLKEVSGWSWLLGLTAQMLSAQAWHKRLQQAAPWLLWLFTELLRMRLSASVGTKRQRILLVDATHLSQMGPKGATWTLQSAYELETSSLAWMRVTDQHQGEGFLPIPMRAGDILVGDGAYSRAGQLLAVDAQKAFSLTRFSPWHLPVYASCAPAETAEFRLDVVAWLQSLRPGTYERHAVVVADGKRLPVRVIAVVLPEEQAEALRRQKQRQASDKGCKLSEQALFLAGFHLLVTTLPQAHWPLALVLELYRCRWQVEILFKRIKQVLDTHRLPCRCAQTAQAMIAALLVAWLLIEEEASQLQRQISDAEPEGMPLSQGQLDRWAWTGLQHVLVGWYSPKQLRAAAQKLRRLFQHKRKRPNQEHQRRLRFHDKLAGEPDLLSLFECSSA